MYFCITTEKNVKAGEVMVLKCNCRGEMICCLIDGTFVGYLCDRQPDGCLGFWEIASAIGSERVLCNVAVKAGKVLIMHTDSKILSNRKFSRVEVEGYGMMVRV